MDARYEPLAQPRFEIIASPTGEQFRVKARKQIFVLLFLPVWLLGWTAGGITAGSQALTSHEPFLILWLCFWAVGWVFASGTLLWMISGAETVRVTGNDLELAHTLFGFSRRWLFQGSQISGFGAVQSGPRFNSFAWQIPFVRIRQIGALKFNYGPRTVCFFAGLDEAEAVMILGRLLAKLPQSCAN